MEPQPAHAPPHCTKCNSPPINGQCTITAYGPLLCSSNVAIKGSGILLIFFSEINTNSYHIKCYALITKLNIYGCAKFYRNTPKLTKL